MASDSMACVTALYVAGVYNQNIEKWQIDLATQNMKRLLLLLLICFQKRQVVRRL